MSKASTMRGAIAAALFAALACTVAGCAGGGGGEPYYGYSPTPYDNGATQNSTCGATGTCPPSNFPRIEPGDRNYGG
jgi:hypothetical protein